MPQTSTSNPAKPSPPAALVAFVSWLIPGAGYWIIGQRTRGVTIGVTIVVMFVLGLMIAGMRVIDVPGFDADGRQILVRDGGGNTGWILTRRPLQEIASKPWFVGQFLAGPLSVLAAWRSIEMAGSVGRPHARLAEIGTLYTAVAGMLNLLAMIDAAYRASHSQTEGEAAA